MAGPATARVSAWRERIGEEDGVAKRVEFGWKVPEFPVDGGDYAAMTRQTLETLELAAGRFDAAWVTDHVLPWARWQAVATPVVECWTTLTFLAARYPQLR